MILAANRDEYYDRPTAPAEFWEDSPALLAVRYSHARGRWLCVNPTTQFS
ncbi:MAG: NRDE family protein [Deltaproteobacteria bacterium]|nr:NRDE family protein [Deltaproteobacteria bacterium]